MHLQLIYVIKFTLTHYLPQTLEPLNYELINLLVIFPDISKKLFTLTFQC